MLKRGLTNAIRVSQRLLCVHPRSTLASPGIPPAISSRPKPNPALRKIRWQIVRPEWRASEREILSPENRCDTRHAHQADEIPPGTPPRPGEKGIEIRRSATGRHPTPR